MEFVLKVLSVQFTIMIEVIMGTISGISYRDPIDTRMQSAKEMDPCNPLYWYPRTIPEHCYVKSTPKPQEPASPPPNVYPLPVPIPIPQTPPFGPIPQIPLLPPPPFPLPPPAIMPPVPQPLPFGLPLIPSSPILPIGGIPYPPQPYLPTPPFSSSYLYRQDQIGMVPGISGLVSNDGGINILPFSDAYSDMLDKHKNKLIRKKLQKLLRDYETYPRFSKRKKQRKFLFY